MTDDIMVSVLVPVYNHEKYIEDCLQGIIKQKANFKFEVIVHDDCSTDQTAEIIRRYEQMYPEIITGIYQSENQYSKKISINKTFLFPRAKGKYIAQCEGDDYWVDENKLQIQVDYMEEHSECTLCFSNAWVIKEDNPEEKYLFLGNGPYHHRDEKVLKRSDYYKEEGGIYKCDEMIKLPVPPTASVLYRAEQYSDIDIDALKSDKIRVGDKQLVVALTALGYAWGSDRCMTVYRRYVPNSATTRWRSSLGEYYQTRLGIIEMYEKLDRYTNYMYADSIQQMIEGVFGGGRCRISENEIRTLVSEAEKVYIYGAGLYAEYCALYLYKQKISFDGFVVSDGRRTISTLFGYPVYEFHEIESDRNIGILTAMDHENFLQIEDALKGRKWCRGCYEIDTCE